MLIYNMHINSLRLIYLQWAVERGTYNTIDAENIIRCESFLMGNVFIG